MSQQTERLGVLLTNLGTPDAPETPAVRRYLRQFLSDPRVVDIHPVARWLLLNLVILRIRPRQSAEAYRKVWTAEGSPLLVHGRALAAALQAELGAPFHVELAMRYGSPSIESAVSTLCERTDRLVVVPLFAHEASATTGSVLEETFRVLSGRWTVPSVAVLPPCHAEPEHVGALAAVARDGLAGFTPDHVLFSFHGLPERHLRKGDPTGETCLRSLDCCAAWGEANRTCYRAQCFETARLLARELELDDGAWSVSFQSRLGRTPWIRPYTDEVLTELAGRGVRRLAVSCAGFSADCLETIEEIGLRGTETFRAAGGEELRLLPCLNAHPAWVAGLARLVRRAAGLAEASR